VVVVLLLLVTVDIVLFGGSWGPTGVCVYVYVCRGGLEGGCVCVYVCVCMCVRCA
jgi:hypothetical protein